MSWLKDYTSFDGRLRRGQALMRYAVVVFVVFVIVAPLSLGLPWFAGRESIMSAFVLAVSYPAYSIMVRRFHDVGLSGWWVAPFIALGLIFSVVPFARRLDLMLSPWWIGLLVAITIPTFAVLLWRGNQGDNRFGAPAEATSLDRTLGRILGARLD